MVHRAAQNLPLIQSVAYPVFGCPGYFMDGPEPSRQASAMSIGVNAKGYQILVVICAACGHNGHVNPARVTRQALPLSQV